MKTSLFLFILLLIGTAEVRSQNNEEITFPDDFFGIYTGTLHIWSKSGEKDIAMEFHLLPTDTLGNYHYKLIYGSGDQKQERGYTLKEKDKTTGEYLVDENNGIILNNRVIDNRMYALFEVGGNLLTTFITFEKDHMIFEISFAPKPEMLTTIAEDEDKTEVISYPVATVQRAVLKKR